jgi:plastocyanin domain-containing protein
MLTQQVVITVVEFVIQILKKAAKLASEAEARRREISISIVLGFRVSSISIVQGGRFRVSSL